MAIQIETITPDSLPLLRGWWEARGHGTMPEGVLPPHGWLASDTHGPAFAAWLYLPEGVPLGIVDWMVGRPGMTPRQAIESGWAVFGAIETFARTRGIKRLFGCAASPAIAREAVRAGFRQAASGMLHLTKDLI